MTYNVESFIDNYNLDSTVSKEDLTKFSEKLIDNYQEFIRDSLLNGQSVTINGVGVLKPYYRKVKNPMGREFSVKARIDTNKDFEKKILSEYRRNPGKFNFNV